MIILRGTERKRNRIEDLTATTRRITDLSAVRE